MLQLTEADQVLLLQIARAAVSSHVLSCPLALPEISSGNLTEPCGIFISIHKQGELRGCVGNVQSAGPLYRTVSECAISAAVSDPRFGPITQQELPVIDFEISVLSSMQQVTDINEIEVGNHGLLISKRGYRGLLLPQVATAYGWDRETFLSETCRKAGLQIRRLEGRRDHPPFQRFSRRKTPPPNGCFMSVANKPVPTRCLASAQPQESEATNKMIFEIPYPRIDPVLHRPRPAPLVRADVHALVHHQLLRPQTFCQVPQT
jgi:AmmeMemoRadiSam system protein A